MVAEIDGIAGRCMHIRETRRAAEREAQLAPHFRRATLDRQVQRRQKRNLPCGQYEFQDRLPVGADGRSARRSSHLRPHKPLPQKRPTKSRTTRPREKLARTIRVKRIAHWERLRRDIAIQSTNRREKRFQAFSFASLTNLSLCVRNMRKENASRISQNKQVCLTWRCFEFNAFLCNNRISETNS